MLLQEEYIQRNAVKDVPLIVYTSWGSAIFNHDDYRYLVMRLEWIYYSWHVGNFKIWIYRAVHNGYRDGMIFKSYDEITIEWDNYHSFFTHWIPLWRRKINPVMKQDALIACWEIFLYCFDGWLARISDPELMKLIDKTFSNTNRDKHIKTAHEYLRFNHPAIAKRFEDAILTYSIGYMDWLSNLFKSNIEKSRLSC